jgi:hypothetical protein
VVLVPVEVPVLPVPPVSPVPVPVPVPVWLGLVPPVAAPVLGAAGVAVAPVSPLDDVEEDDDDDELSGVVDDGVLLEASSVAVAALSSEDAAAPPIDVLAGATSACGFLGTTSCVVLAPPQADRPTVARRIRATAVARRRMGGS